MSQAQNYSRVIVTGATGWLGRRLIAALRRESADIRLRCLVAADESAAWLYERGAEVVGGDVRDPETIAALFKDAQGALVFHLAGIIHPPGRARFFDDINFHGTANVLSAANAAGARRLVAMSSNSPLGYNAHPEAVFDEESPYRPYMGYGRSKWRMELLLRTAMPVARPEIVIVRAPWFYGPGQPPRQTLFFKMVREGRFPVLGSGRQRRSMAYIDSLAQALLLCARPAAAGQIYWIADTRAYPMREVVDTVKAVLREDFGLAVKDRDMRLPSLAADVARLADRGLQALGLYHQKIHVLSEMNLTIACDVRKAMRELDYQPLVELREGMRRSVQWCLDNGHSL